MGPISVHHGRWRRRSRAAGVVVGLALGAVAIQAMRTPPAQTVPIAEISLRASGSAELAVAAADPLAGGQLGPGDSLAGTLTVRNQTGEILALRARAHTAGADGDRALRLRVTGARTLVGAGSPADLGRAGPATLWLAPGGAVPLRVEAWIDPALAAAVGGRQIEVALDFPVEVVG